MKEKEEFRSFIQAKRKRVFTKTISGDIICTASAVSKSEREVSYPDVT